jgi:hypothetical protein
MKLDRNTSTSSGTRKAKKIGTGWTNFAAVAMETKKGDLNIFGFLSSNFMNLCRNFHRSVWQLLEVLQKFKMAAVTMVTKVQNGRKIQKSSDLGEIWFPSRL